jgi:hypothetical protein
MFLIHLLPRLLPFPGILLFSHIFLTSRQRYTLADMLLFFPACFALSHSDIASFPTELRAVLEQCLAEEPSPQALETFKPQLRRVLYKLLKGLDARQAQWRVATNVGQASPLSPYKPDYR